MYGEISLTLLKPKMVFWTTDLSFLKLISNILNKDLIRSASIIKSISLKELNIESANIITEGNSKRFFGN